jgi:hypothetical protein
VNVNQNQFIPGAERRTAGSAAESPDHSSRRPPHPTRSPRPGVRSLLPRRRLRTRWARTRRRPTWTHRRPPGVRRRCLVTRPPWRAPATAAAGTTMQEGSSWRIATRRARSSARARTESSSRPSTPRYPSHTNLLNPPFLICGRPPSLELELG